MRSTLDSLIESTRSTLLEGLELIESVDDEAYAAAPTQLETDSAGNHMRHCLEFFGCFLTGLSAGAVDYAARKRDRAVGRDRLLGMLRIAEVLDSLEQLRGEDSEAAIAVRAEDELEGAWTPSTLGRELEFLRSHTVHHYALIALILRAHEAQVPASFGVAPSTLRHQAEVAACAR